MGTKEQTLAERSGLLLPTPRPALRVIEGGRDDA